MDTIQDVLIYQTQMMRNSSLGPYVPAEFSPPEYIVVVNALFYASLGIMLLAAFIAMLIKSWVREFDRGLRAMSLPEQRAKTREFRYLGLERWKLPEMVAILPLLIQLSLLLFSIGLVDFLFHVSKPSFGITMSIFGVGTLYYAITTSISVFVTSSPFHSPLSRTLGKMYQHVHSYFCPGVDVFLSPEMDTMSATALGRLHQCIRIFLQKWRPYLEGDFVGPITGTTLDEVQLSTAMSALERIHESVPNSQHSETVQWSVWQAASGPDFRIPPSFNLPSWIFDKGDDEVFLSRLPPAMVVALTAFSLRTMDRWDMNHRLYAARRSEGPWAQLVSDIFHIHLDDWAEFNDSTNILQLDQLQVEERLWLLNTLSELHTAEGVQQAHPLFFGICIAMISETALKWRDRNKPDIVLLDAVVTLAAILCSPNPAHRHETLTNSRQYPWLLLNLRNPELVSKMIEDVPSNCHKQLISLLFLVVSHLLRQNSDLLAVQYFGIIKAKCDYPFYASALTAVAPALGDTQVSAFGRVLVAPQTKDLLSILHDYSWSITPNFQEELLQDYDHQLEASQNPDPNTVAILLVASKDLSLSEIADLQDRNFDLENPWLRLTARVIARLDVPDGSPMDLVSFTDRRVHNMLAALSLLRYTNGEVHYYTEALFLASLLKPWELTISALALKYYLRTIMAYSNVLEPPCHLISAVRAVFNHLLPNHQLQMGWPILGVFVDGFEHLSVNWRQTFAKAFFTLSHQPLPKLRGRAKANTPESELEDIITWEYFHEEEREPQYTDSEFSGLDWMVMAWSLHLSQQCWTNAAGGSTQGRAPLQDLGAPMISDEFVLRALSKLLDAAPYYQVTPIIPKLREFIEWFSGPSLSEYRIKISGQIEEVDRRHQKFRRSHSFHCMWYI